MKIFEHFSVCLLTVVQQSQEQRWRRFLFCLQPARPGAAAKYSNLFALGICWCDVGCKPSDSRNVYCRQYIQEQLGKTTSEINQRKETKEYEFNSAKTVQSRQWGSCRKKNGQRLALIFTSKQKLNCKEQVSTVTVGQTCNNMQ